MAKCGTRVPMQRRCSNSLKVAFAYDWKNWIDPIYGCVPKVKIWFADGFGLWQVKISIDRRKQLTWLIVILAAR